MTSERKPAVVMHAAEIEAHAVDFVHPWNPTSSLRGAFLARPAGLKRTGINLIRLAPANQSFTYHAHLHEEEWIYIVAGTAVLESGGVRHDVGAGDFVAFPTPSEPHQLRNESEADVVYLSGGEKAELDVADFPRLGKRLVRIGDRSTVYDLARGEALPIAGIEKL